MNNLAPLKKAPTPKRMPDSQSYKKHRSDFNGSGVLRKADSPFV
jgi:hypothetical protein